MLKPRKTQKKKENSHNPRSSLLSKPHLGRVLGLMMKHGTLQAVAALRLLPHDIQDRVDELGAFGVVTFGPVVPSSGLSEHEVIGSEDLSIWTRAHTVHSAGLQVHEHRTGHISPATGLVVVHIDALQLQIGDSLISSSRVDSVLLTYHLPELGTDLVAALSSLDVQNLTHVCEHERRSSSSRNKTEENTTTTTQRSAQERKAELRRREISQSRAERCSAAQRKKREKNERKEIDAGHERREKWNVHIRYVHPCLYLSFIRSVVTWMKYFHLDEYLLIYQSAITWMKNAVWTSFL